MNISSPDCSSGSLTCATASSTSLRSRSALRRWTSRFAALALAGLAVGAAHAETIILLTTDNRLAFTSTANPAAISKTLTITGLASGETLVGIDVRPQNQQLYALGVATATNTMTLYRLSTETGVAVALREGEALTVNGGAHITLPASGYDIDFNPAADRLRIVTESGLNFRMNPNTGRLVDGDNTGLTSGAVTGDNPDGPINGGTTSVSGAAYTNNRPNNGNITTLYTLDRISNALYIQSPPNVGTQTSGQTVTVNGAPLDFGVGQFDIPPGVNAATTNLPALSGVGFFTSQQGTKTKLYQLNLGSAAATELGEIDLPVLGMAIRTELYAGLAIDSTGTSLIRFDPLIPSTTTTVAISGVSAGETLVGLDARPQTGQIMTLGLNGTLNNGTLYLLDPQTGAASPMSAVGAIAFVDAGGNPVSFNDAANTGYGMDFNPTVDRIRVVSRTGYNFRINPNNGATVDGNLGQATVNGNNMDGPLNGAATGGVATAYTNSYPQPQTGGFTTQYTLDSVTDRLMIQNPPNAGTLINAIPITVSGIPLNFTNAASFDIPGSVRVAASATVAQGEGWLTDTNGGGTRIYRVNLATGVADTVGDLSATNLRGATFLSVPQRLVDDAVATAGLPTRVYPLANDGLDASAQVTAVSNSSIVIEGRTLLIPAGFTGSFTYTASDFSSIGRATMTVAAGVPVTNATTFTGLLRTPGGDVSGWAKVAISAKGVATVQIRGGANAISAKATFPNGQDTVKVFTKLGQLTVTRNGTASVDLSLAALGGNVGGKLRPAQAQAMAGTYHLALASGDFALPGGGYAVAKISTKAGVTLTGLLPDGVPFSAATSLSDNSSFSFFAVATKAKPPGILGGECAIANLTKTDVTGEIVYAKAPQAKGALGKHLSGVDTVVTANGSQYTGVLNFAGNGTLTLSGGNLAVGTSTVVTVSAKNVPETPTGALQSWTGVSAKVGKFSVKVTVPTLAKPVSGSGLYLPKSKEAWGYFPGTTDGGRVRLAIP